MAVFKVIKWRNRTIKIRKVVAQIDAQLQKLAQIMRTDVPAFNQLVKDQNIPAVVVKP